MHQETGTRKRQIGIGRIYFFDGELIPLPGDGQISDNDALDLIGGVLGRTRAGILVFINIAIAPHTLLAQIQDVLGAVPQAYPIYNIVDTGEVGVVQMVIDIHQFLRADGGRIIQGTLLIAPDHCLNPGIHGPNIARIPNIVNTEGMCLIRKNPSAVGIKIGHHDLDCLIIDDLRTIPRMTI